MQSQRPTVAKNEFIETQGILGKMPDDIESVAELML